MKPILKWAGGKSWALAYLKKYIKPNDLLNCTYIEPFCGSGAIAFGLQPKKAILNDLNSELINVYQVIKTHPQLLIDRLKIMQEEHSEELYYQIRAWDRDPIDFAKMNSIAHAARFIYLNKTGFNGLMRYNSKGFCNTPIGRTASGKKPDIVQEALLKELSQYLTDSVTLCCEDYINITKQAKPGDIVLLDPPYDYENQKGFVSYTSSGWTRENLIKLKTECDRLTSQGCRFLAFNNNTSFVQELFQGYKQEVLLANRNINCKGANRSKVEEVLVYNF